MGTRADFYVGTGKNAEWLGSVAWDGFEFGNNPDCPLMKAKTESEFRAAVKQISADRTDWTSPEQGWPWPWDDSFTTDRCYAFADGRAQAFVWGKIDGETVCEWPDMSERQNVTMGRRSGLMVIDPERGIIEED